MRVPIYEYECERCQHRFEIMQRFSERPLKKCEECGGPVHKILSAPGLVFKGSGWYVTDYANPERKKAADAAWYAANPERAKAIHAAATAKLYARRRASGPLRGRQPLVGPSADPADSRFRAGGRTGTGAKDWESTPGNRHSELPSAARKSLVASTASDPVTRSG